MSSLISGLWQVPPHNAEIVRELSQYLHLVTFFDQLSHHHQGFKIISTKLPPSASQFVGPNYEQTTSYTIICILLCNNKNADYVGIVNKSLEKSSSLPLVNTLQLHHANHIQPTDYSCGPY
jgi:hypothetical protein